MLRSPYYFEHGIHPSWHLDELDSLCSTTLLRGVISSCHKKDGQLDESLARAMSMITRKADVELWHDRSYLFYAKKDFQSLKEAGWTGIVVSLHGDTNEAKLNHVRDMVLAAKESGLRSMVSGVPRRDCMAKMPTAVETFILPVAADFPPELCPWRNVDIRKSFWGDLLDLRVEDFSPVVNDVMTFTNI